MSLPCKSQLPEDVEKFFKSFPPGYRFKPRDEELVVHYLKNKLFNKPLPPNRIKEVQLYKYNPEILVEHSKSYGEGEWYFFTPRDKKYRNGSRPRRAAGDGYWKATGADRLLKFQGVEVGYRKALVFYIGKPPKGQKTDWMMHEFRLKDPPKISNLNKDDMRLDDWVLCKIYKKMDKSMRSSSSRQAAGTQNQESDSEVQPESENKAVELEREVPEYILGETADGFPQGFMAFSELGHDHELEEHGGPFKGLATSLGSFYDDSMLEQNSAMFPNSISDYYDENLMQQMTVLDPLPSSIPPFRSFRSMDKLPSVSYNFDFSSQFFDL
ncbi:NAC transcription factor 29-like [Herrania umbratica]|uniref:NAC transcription factor 29-like n=1 Tax=Herrania umbratica TaxID=108875 RepID=A0A6J1BMW8_9ROSI|nr:NAC transcription factor 29-like [Herrania umbratica]